MQSHNINGINWFHPGFPYGKLGNIMKIKAKFNFLLLHIEIVIIAETLNWGKTFLIIKKKNKKINKSGLYLLYSRLIHKIPYRIQAF